MSEANSQIDSSRRIGYREINGLAEQEGAARWPDRPREKRGGFLPWDFSSGPPLADPARVDVPQRAAPVPIRPGCRPGKESAAGMRVAVDLANGAVVEIVSEKFAPFQCANPGATRGPGHLKSGSKSEHGFTLAFQSRLSGRSRAAATARFTMGEPDRCQG